MVVVQFTLGGMKTNGDEADLPCVKSEVYAEEIESIFELMSFKTGHKTLL